MKSIRLLAFVLTMQLVNPFALLASPLVTATSTRAMSSQAARQSAPLNLNLSSTKASISAAALALSKSLTINVGGVNQLVNSSSLLTAAEFVAASQVASGSAQTLSIGAAGNATGGRLSLTSALTAQLGNLVIPQGVKVFDNVGSLGALQLSGNFVDAGKFTAVSTNPAITSAVIDAINIYVQAGGSLTSVSDVGSKGSIGALGHAMPALSLTLNASNNVVNSGSITSSGNLNVAAGGTITNASVGTAQASSAPLMQAMNDVNLYSSAGNIVNSGLVASTAGNINLSTLASQNLNINAANGTFLAANGAINLRDASFSGSGNTYVNGGNLLSQTLNVYAGNGVTDVSVDQLTGTVNATGYGAHVMAATSTLKLGNINVIDPTFYNDGSVGGVGNIDLTGDIEVAEPVAIVASGDITDSTGAEVTISSTGTGNSGNITLVAGAAISTTDCSGCTAVSRASGVTGNVVSGKTITVTGASATGGNIDLNNATNGFTINTSGNNVTLVAFNGTNVGANKGAIVLPSSSSITAAGSASCPACGVAVIAGGVDGAIAGHNAIELGNITAGAGGGEANGTITVSTSQPTASTGVTFDSTGAATGMFGTTSTTSKASVSILAINSSGETTTETGGNGGAVTITAGSSVLVGDGGINSSGANNENGTGGNGGAVTITAGSSVVVGSGGINSSGNGSGIGGNGGAVTITAGSSVSIGDGGIMSASDSNGASGGNGGVVTITAGSSVSVGTHGIASYGDCPDSLTGGGASGNGGGVTITAGSSVSVGNDGIVSSGVNDGSAPGGNGGVVTITAGSSVLVGTAGISSYGVNYGANGGNAGAVTITAGSSVSIGDIGIFCYGNNNGFGIGGNGGTVTITSGSFVSVGASGIYSPGQSNGAGGNGGSVGIAALGTISVGSIDTDGVGSYSGNIFVSSGFASAGAVNLGSLDTSTSTTGAGTIFLGAADCPTCTNGLADSNANIIYSTTSAQSGSATPVQAYLFFNKPSSNPSSITSNKTIYVTTGVHGVTIYPGIYTSNIGSGNGVNLILDLGGDSRTVVPLVTTGNIHLASFTASNTYGGSASYQNNGYPVVLVSAGSMGTTLSGNVTSNPYTGSVGSAGNVNMMAVGSGGINNTSGTISGSTIVLSSITGNIGSSTSAIATQTGSLSATGGGNIYLSDNNSGGSATVFLNSIGTAVLGPSSAAGNFQLTTPGSVTLNNIITTGGNINVVAFTGTITVADSALIVAHGGSLTIQNSDGNSGSIVVDSGASLMAPSGSAVQVELFVGSAPPAQSNPVSQSNVTVSTSNGGEAFLGASGITAFGANTVTATGSGALVVLSTGNEGASAITLQGSGGGINISAGIAPPSPLTSFDLTQRAVTSQIQTDINDGAITGTLKLTSTGAATTGTSLTLPYPALLSGTLSAFNIPANVSVTLENFQSGDTIAVDLTSTSTTKQVLISGAGQFGTGSTSATMHISTNTTTEPMLSVAATGSLTNTTGALSITLDNAVLSPSATTVLVSTAGSLTAAGNLTVTGNGSMTMGGTVNATSGNTLSLTATNKGSISLTGKIGVTGATDDFTVSNTGTITQGTSATLTGSTFNFTGGTGVIGASASAPIKTTATAGTFSFTSFGDVYVSNTGRTDLAASTAALLNLKSSGALTIGGSLTVTGSTSTAAVTLTATAGGITISDPVSASGAISLTATVGAIVLDAGMTAGSTMTLTASSQSGAITRSAGTLSAATLTLTTGTAGGSIGLNDAITTSAGTIVVTASASGSSAFITDTSAVTVDTTTVGGTFSLTAGGTITDADAIKGTTIDLSTTGGTSSILIKAAMGTTTTSSVDLSTAGTGSITESATSDKITSSATASVTLSTDGGNIGSSATSYFATTAGTLTVTTGGAAGSVYLDNTNSGMTTLANNAASGGAFSLIATGALTVNSVTTAQGAITLKAGTGKLLVNSNADLNAVGGALTLQHTGAVSGTGPFIELGSSAKLNSSSGNLNVVIGTTIPTPGGLTTNTNVAVTGTNVFFGAKGITATGSNSATAQGTDKINFSTGTNSAADIKLDGGVQLTAVSARQDTPEAGEAIVDTGDGNQDDEQDRVFAFSAAP